ncbi:putative uncharacterized protein DDB_G0277255 [Stomoxys calcitrans]|uniref:putative uncharacterized protein DDB_G0277255 n=1 Tax=Stomoxys calcitrans TaxID=35570 RepID=UPI0027E32025|nr:putative uncharacterized protein DDB_G0277255 [Stomoxys calcitrans]
MIQEPQHPLPMQTIQNPTKLPMIRKPALQSCPEPKATLSTNQPLQTKNRTTVLKIPKQTSKPRIFLLTRPANTQLVRKASPQIAEVHQKSSNLVSAAPESSLRATPRIIRIPFLTKSQSNVKINTSPETKNSQKFSPSPSTIPLKNLDQLISVSKNWTAKSEPKSKDSLIIKQEIIQYPHTKDICQESVKQPIPIQEYTVRQKPSSTLASMAGIELTGADMCPTAADMSGAMPPTATVEEINVPVFIDEYLQQAAISTLSATTSSTSVTTSNINNSNSNTTNNNNNSTINYNNRYNRITSDSGKESSSSSNTEVNHHCLDTFENFEFDIELLTENKSKDQDKASTGQLLQKQLSADDKHHLNQSTTTNLLDHLIPYDIEEGTDTDTEKQKQQLQMMLDEILFGNTEQQSCSNNNNNNNPLNNNNNNCATLNPNTNSTAMDFNNDNFFGDCNSDDIFNFPPTSQNLNDDNLFSDDFASINSSIEDAVDINHMDNAGIPLMDFDLSQCSYSNNYMHSQSPDVMFPCGSQAMAKPQTLAAALSQEILEAEPHVAPDLIHASTYSNCGVGDDNDNNNAPSIPIQVDFIDGHDNLHEETATCSETSTSTLQPMGGGCESPKLFNPSKSERMQEKRSKLHLDTKRRRRMDEISPMDTPGIVNMLDEMRFFQQLMSSSPSNEAKAEIKFEIDEVSLENVNVDGGESNSIIIKSEADHSNFSDDISSSCTTYSCNSNSNQTNFTNILNASSPCSPTSSSCASTSTNTKRGRGRPAKLHSDMPDLSQIAHLSETEQKKVLERAKNNEASRKSRLKNKQRDIEMEREELWLSEQNRKLEEEYQSIEHMRMKFQRALKRVHLRFSPY